MRQACERSGVGYVMGFPRNGVLERKIADLLERVRLQCIQSGQKARWFDDVYYAASTWESLRRLVMKAEWLPKGANPRFVLTKLELSPQALYDRFYVQRGADSEHRIKELKLGIPSDRLSCHNFIANQFRLLLSQAAYILMLAIRQAAVGTQLATAQLERWRSMLIKGAARVQVCARRVLVELAVYCPFADELRLISQRLLSATALLLN